MNKLLLQLNRGRYCSTESASVYERIKKLNICRQIGFLCLLSHALCYYRRVVLGLGEENYANPPPRLNVGHVTQQAMCLPFASVDCSEEVCFDSHLLPMFPPLILVL